MASSSSFALEAIENAVKSIEGSTPSDIRILLSMFLKAHSSIVWDSTLEAPAAIEMTKNPRILANAVMILEVIQQGLEEWRLVGRTEDDLRAMLIPRWHNDAINLVTTLFLGLILHELGHHLYSLPAEESEAMLKLAPPVVQDIPMPLLGLLSNVVEDSFIQAQFRKDYPGPRYGKALAFLQLFSQGQVKTYEQGLAQGVTPYNALYYFIIRSYNGFVPEVQRLFDCPALPWQSDTLAKFDFVESIVDTEVRAQHTHYELAPLVWRDLQDHKDQLQDFNNGNNDSDDDEGGESGDLGNGSGKQGREGREGEPGANKPSNKGAKSSKSGKSSKANKPGGSGAGNAPDQPDSQSKPNDDKNDQGSGQSSQSKGMTEQQLREAVEKAAKEILKRLHDHERHGNSKEKLQPTDPEDEAARRGAALGIGLQPLPSNATMTLPAFAEELYRECTTWFSKIFNQTDETLTHLQSGDLSEDLVIDWYTEKSTAIWERTIHARNGRNFQVIFLLDRSGSMSGKRFTTSAGILAAMCHAFEDHRIKSAIYVFNSDSKQIKTLEEPAVLCGGESNIMSALDANGPSGGTDPSSAFTALQHDPAYINDDAKIVFFLTDGEVNREAPIQEAITELSARGDWFFIPIGINFGPEELARLQSFTEPGIARSYSDRDLTSLGEDIFKIIDEEFIN